MIKKSNLLDDGNCRGALQYAPTIGKPICQRQIPRQRRVKGLYSRIFFLLLFLFPFFFSIPAKSETGEGGYAGSFLLLGMEARALGMGGAFVGVADNPSCGLFNPAGAIQIQKNTFSASYRKMSLDRKMGWLSYFQPVREEAVLGLSWINAGVGEVLGRDDRGEPTENISNYENFVSFTFARRMTDRFYLGLNMKYSQFNLANISTYGIGFDFGTMIKPIQNLRLGLVVDNIGLKYRWTTGDYWKQFGGTGTESKDQFPLNFKVGGSYLLLKDKLLVTLEMDKNNKQKQRFFGGAEYQIIKELAGRIGYNDGSFSFGFGVNYDFKKFIMGLDYAFVSSQVETDGDHIVSMKIEF
jgi:hypothetical protein